MSAPQTLQVVILDKDYQVSCPPEEREALLRSADELDQRMRRIRASGGVIGLERIAIMAALNLTYELLQSRRNQDLSDQTQQLLKCAGYPQLYVKLPFDSVVLYGLFKALSVVQINELLFSYGLETLG